MNLIKLTEWHSRDAVYVNMDCIVVIVRGSGDCSGGTYVRLIDDNSLTVCESADEVARKISNHETIT